MYRLNLVNVIATSQIKQLALNLKTDMWSRNNYLYLPKIHFYHHEFLLKTHYLFFLGTLTRINTVESTQGPSEANRRVMSVQT